MSYDYDVIVLGHAHMAEPALEQGVRLLAASAG